MTSTQPTEVAPSTSPQPDEARDRTALPFVSVVMPVYNEEAFIAKSLGAVLAQTYPKDRFEVLVVDGRSEDATRERVAAIDGGRVPIRLIDNPERSRPAALNHGLAAAAGTVVTFIDGHCLIPPHYVSTCIDALERTGADCVGGRIETLNEEGTATGQAIALAQSAPFGVGGVAFRTGTDVGGYVDTLAFGAYRSAVFDRIGDFDETLIRTEDDEFNLRLIQAGGTIWLEPGLETIYYSRASLRKLWRQYYEYGLYKVGVMRKHRTVASWRHLVPVVFVLALAASLVLALVSGTAAWLLPVGGSYLAANLLASVWTARAHLRLAPIVSAAFAVLHLSYGLGMINGLFRWLRGTL